MRFLLAHLVLLFTAVATFAAPILVGGASENALLVRRVTEGRDVSVLQTRGGTCVQPPESQSSGLHRRSPAGNIFRAVRSGLSRGRRVVVNAVLRPFHAVSQRFRNSNRQNPTPHDVNPYPLPAAPGNQGSFGSQSAHSDQPAHGHSAHSVESDRSTAGTHNTVTDLTRY